jgi:hypothetical protein
MEVGMLKPRSFLRRQNKGVLQVADDLTTAKLEENYTADLARVGIMWSGILELDGPIPASEVAAMLSCVDLVRATTLIDSEKHWISAASHAAIAAYSDVNPEVALPDESDVEEDEKPKNKIGFASANESQ